MALADYFASPEAKRYLLVEITRQNANSTKYYLADDAYITEPSDTPANTPYNPIIQGGGIGDISRVLNNPFDGNASTGFGQINLASDVAWTDDAGSKSDTQMTLVKGADVVAYLAAPPTLFPKTDAIKLLEGTINRVGGSSTGGVNFEIIDKSENIRNKLIEIDTKPLCFGHCRNVTPFLTNPASLEYHVHDGPIEAVDAVYDQGVALTPTTQYTVDLSTGKITLVSSPVGIVTADVKGAKPSGVWLTSTEDIISELLSRAGVSITENYDLPTGTIGLYVEQNTDLGTLLNRLTRACAGFWIVNANSEFQAKQYPVPQETVAVASYNATQILEEVNFNLEDRLFDTINYTYKTNWSVYQSLPGATTAQADFSQKPYVLGIETSVSPDTELVYQESPIFETLFDSSTDAQSVAQRLLSIYEVSRYIYELELPYTQKLSLTENISFEYSTEILIGTVVGVNEIFDGDYPRQRVTLLV